MDNISSHLPTTLEKRYLNDKIRVSEADWTFQAPQPSESIREVTAVAVKCSHRNKTTTIYGPRGVCGTVLVVVWTG